MTAIDGRRSRYVPVDVLVAFSPFGTKLVDRWGMEGLCAWMLLLAAAKREPVQGTFTYTSEAEAWTKLGATASGFTFDEFVTLCGRAKQTKKTHCGRVVYVEIRGWKRWNEAFAREEASQRMSRKRAQNTRTVDERSAHDTRTEVETETEVEVEDEPNHPGSATFKIPDPLGRLLAALPDKDELTHRRIESMHRRYRFAEGDFEEAIEATQAGGVTSPSAVAISVLKRRGQSKEGIPA